MNLNRNRLWCDCGRAVAYAAASKLATREIVQVAVWRDSSTPICARCGAIALRQASHLAGGNNELAGVREDRKHTGYNHLCAMGVACDEWFRQRGIQTDPFVRVGVSL
jgi:hypothetical protein